MSDNLKKLLVGLVYGGAMFLAGYELGRLVQTLHYLSGAM